MKKISALIAILVNVGVAYVSYTGIIGEFEPKDWFIFSIPTIISGCVAILTAFIFSKRNLAWTFLVLMLIITILSLTVGIAVTWPA